VAREAVWLAKPWGTLGLLHVVVLRYYALSPRTRVGGVELAARLGWRFGWDTRYGSKVRTAEGVDNMRLSLPRLKLCVTESLLALCNFYHACP
jgi:hypothetical protein